MHKIHLLPDLLIKQIAAGEVIQRPASVVKELIDNAIDAGSTSIIIVVKEAGKALIQVIDNGSGMVPADVRICFEKHATSKITHIDDLYKIQTMGFRGEALASVAAVAQVEMESCLHDAPIGTSITIEGGTFKNQEPIAVASGTKISVKNLFYNVPARRNFLKTDHVEFKHIVEEVQHAALARPDIGFTLYHNSKEIYKLPSAKVSHRIVHLFGTHYKQQLLPCQEHTNIVTITGYIGKPEQAKKTRGEQFLFVNGRFIKHASLYHAIKNGYDRLLAADCFPFYVLYITISPELIDINVHPTKIEVKFQEEKTLYAILQAVVKKSLTSHFGDVLDFEQNISDSVLSLANPVTLQANPTRLNPLQSYSRFSSNQAPPLLQISKNWQDLFGDVPESPRETSNQLDDPLIKQGAISQAIQLYNRYIITHIASGTLLIDQQAAHERILYDKFTAYFQHKNGASQQLLLPEQLTLNPADYAILEAHSATLRALGFIVEPFGPATMIIHGSPVELGYHPPKKLLEEIIDQLKGCRQKIVLDPVEHFIRALAKKASVEHGRKLKVIEIDTLLAQLFSSENMHVTPDGKKICVLLSQDVLLNLFQ